MRRTVLFSVGSAFGLAVIVYAFGLGVYATTSTEPEICTQPASAEEAAQSVERLGLAAEYPFPHRFASTPHGRMHYVDVGSGPTLLCLHGNPTWSFLYRHMIEGLSDRARLVAPDLIGFGLSEKLPDPDDYTLAGHVDDVSALVESLGLEELMLVLHGWGGAVGLGVAVRYPERVRALVVMNGSAFGPDADGNGPRVPPVVRLARVPIVGEELVQGLGVLHRQGIRSGLARKERRQPEVLRAYRVVQASWEERAGALAFPRLLPPDTSPTVLETLREQDRFLRSFEGPVLLLWGLQDRAFGASVLAAWRERLPHATVVEIPDAGHLLPEDAHEEVTGQLRMLLDRLERGQP
jgi:haloalkane dehalogenase